MIPLRDENRASSTPVVTYLLILLCAAVFLYTLSLGSEARIERFFFAYGATPSKVTGQAGSEPLAAYPTLITSMFLHGGWAHLIGNMLYLWIFGDNVEDAMGRVGFLLFYLMTGIAAVLTHTFLHPGSTAPLVGASGAIAGVLGGYLVLYPGARILSLVPLGFFIRVVAVPAYLFLPVWFVMQFIFGLADLAATATTVAWWAHVGGFVAGVVLVRLFARRRASSRW